MNKYFKIAIACGIISIFSFGISIGARVSQNRNPYETPQMVTWVTINWAQKESVTIKLPSGPEYSSTTKNLMVTVLLPDNKIKSISGEDILKLLEAK